MLLRNTESSVRPTAVLLDRLEDGTANVRMAVNIREEDRDGQAIYVFDEAVFTLGNDRTETAEDIASEFDAWWVYGTQEDEAAPTLEERVELIEMMLMGGLE